MVAKDVKTEKGFRKLIVWQKAHQWVLMIYELTEEFPKQEIFGLVSQTHGRQFPSPQTWPKAMQPVEKASFAGTLISHKVHWLKWSII